MIAKVFEKGCTLKYLQKYDLFREKMSSYQGSLDPGNCSIDFKVHVLSLGEVPSRPIWHYDGTNSPLMDACVKYELMLSGDALSATRFFLREPEAITGTEAHIHKQAKRLEDEGLEVRYLSFDVWSPYTSRNLHAASHALVAGERVLIRLKENR